MIDRLRTTKPSVTNAVVLGFDPDLDTTGWCLIIASIHKPALGHPPIQEVHIGLIESGPAAKGLIDLEKTEVMVWATTMWPPENLMVGAYSMSARSAATQNVHKDSMGALATHHCFVEAQRIYPNKDETPKERVGKGNDLIHLAQVTGALQAAGHRLGYGVQAVLPQTWKGQGSKGSTVALLQERFASVPIHVHVATGYMDVTAAKLDRLPGKMGHALDAAGIALYGLDYLAVHGASL